MRGGSTPPGATSKSTVLIADHTGYPSRWARTTVLTSMNLVFKILDWRQGAKWMPYLFVAGVLLGIWLAMVILFLLQVPPGGLI